MRHVSLHLGARLTQHTRCSTTACTALREANFALVGKSGEMFSRWRGAARRGSGNCAGVTKAE